MQVEELLIRVQDCSYDIIVTGNEDNSDGSDNSEEMSGEEFYCEMLYEKKFYSVCWGKLYRRDFISKYKFDVAYKIGEDLEFFSRIDFSASNVLYLKKRIYVYRENEQSVTKPVYNENWGKEVALCRRIVETSEGQIRKAAVVRYVRINASCITYAIASQNFTVVKTMKKNIKKFLIQYMLNKRVSVNLKMKIIAKTFLPVWILRLI